jgi:hypothetical protein
MMPTMPEFCKPRLRTSTAATVITAGLLNPMNACSMGINPVSVTIKQCQQGNHIITPAPRDEQDKRKHSVPKMIHCSRVMAQSYQEYSSFINRSNPLLRELT